MAKQPTKAKQAGRSLRQTTEDKASSTKRSFKTPVRKMTRPLGRARAKASKGFLGKVGRFLVPKYFRSSWSELRQVTWPDRGQTARLTTAVIIFATVFGIIIAIVDYGLDKLFRGILLK